MRLRVDMNPNERGDRAELIEAGLAVSIAGQVALGLTRGDGQEERALGALTAIGLMIVNCSGTELVGEVLAMAERQRITRLPDGGWRIETEAVEDRGEG